ncbi:MAG: alpha/beta hydrolase family protein [Anaerolineae bacterium]
MDDTYPELDHYPEPDEIDDLISDLWEEAASAPFEVEVLEEQGFRPALGLWHMRGFAYVRFEPEGMAPFYGYWQPAPSQPAPLLVHTPGYGAEMQIHPDLVARGYNVLHVNPLGYATPEGFDESKRMDDEWPVFVDSIVNGFDRGYRPWLINVMQAVSWAQEEEAVLPDRLAFFGTSQGGGASLLLGSIFRDQGVRSVAADEPWLIHFPAYRALRPDWAQRSEETGDIFEAIEHSGDPGALWRELGKIDALAHVHRLTMPVLLTAGGDDTTCPMQTIRALYDRLPSTKSLTQLDGVSHGYTQAFPYLAAAWFRLYV